MKPIFSTLVFTIVLLILFSCKNKETQSSQKYIFTSTESCEDQELYVNRKVDLKLIFVDSKGAVPDKFYSKSPSLNVKKQLAEDISFTNFANNNFDFIVLTQDCPAGIENSKKYNVLSWPTILLVDLNGKVLFESVGITHPARLKKDLDNVIKNQ